MKNTVHHLITVLLIVWSMLFGPACRERVVKNYLFIGHGYQWGTNDRVDFRLEKLDYSDYDQVWLGGDICAGTTESPHTLRYLDSLFQLSWPSRHWATGNHDIRHGHTGQIEAVTGKPLFYTTRFDDICLMVLNTNYNHFQVSTVEDQCSQLALQYRMIEKVCDTIRQARKLIVLHHHALLNDRIADTTLHLNEVFNFYRDSFLMRCAPETWFESSVYAKLTAVRKKGIQVVMVSGDLGQRAKSFQYLTPENIWFLGSGINNTCSRTDPPPYVTNFQPDSLLIFHNRPGAKELQWEFVSLDQLAGVRFDIAPDSR